MTDNREILTDALRTLVIYFPAVQLHLTNCPSVSQYEYISTLANVSYLTSIHLQQCIKKKKKIINFKQSQGAILSDAQQSTLTPTA